MAGKKSFRDALNPAMQFISTPEASEPEPLPFTPIPGEQPVKRASAPQTKKRGRPSAAPEKPLKASDAPEGYRVNPAFIEKKTRRLQLLMRPSLYDRLKAKAEAEGLSVNEVTDILLEEALSDQRKRRK